MNKLLVALLSILFAFTMVATAQNANSSTARSDVSAPAAKKKVVFRATAEQIKQAQTNIKQRGFYAGEASGKLDADTRVGLKKYQQAEGLKATGTLNKITLEKMSIALTEKQKSM